MKDRAKFLSCTMTSCREIKILVGMRDMWYLQLSHEISNDYYHRYHSVSPASKQTFFLQINTFHSVTAHSLLCDICQSYLV